MTTFEWTDRDGETHEIVPETGWKNYGDAHPQDWGGLFVRWDGISWEVIGTRPPAELPDGLSETEHMVEETLVWPEDVWVDGDPDAGPTSLTQRCIDALATLESYGQALLEQPPEYFAAEHVRYHGGRSTEWVDDAEYQTWLDDMGIDA